MAEQLVQLKRIQEKLNQLLKQYSALQKENTVLKREMEEKKQQAGVFEEKSEKLKQQLAILQFSNGDMNDAEKKEFEKRINSYLKEIDRCITLLGQ